jgi:ABC-type amino acid transport substrate-binding protein
MTTVERIEWRLRHDAVAEEWWPAGTVAKAIGARRAGSAQTPARRGTPGADFYERTTDRRPRAARALPGLSPAFGVLVLVVAIAGALLLSRELPFGTTPTPEPSPTIAPSPTPILALERIRAAGAIQIAVVGETTSVHGKVAEAVAERLGVPAELTKASRAEIGAGDWYPTYDLAVGMVRGTFFEHVYWLGDYGFRPAYLFVPADSTIDSPIGLGGRLVCVREHSDPEDWIAGFHDVPSAIEPVAITPPAELTFTTQPSDEACLAELDAGRVDAVFADELGSAVRDDPTYRALGPIFVERLVFVVPIVQPEAAQLIDPVDQIVLHDLYAEGVLPGLLAGPSADGTTGQIPGGSPAPS